MSAISVNQRAQALLESLVGEASALRLQVSRSAGALVVDAGIGCTGSLEAGRRIAEICMGGLGSVMLSPAARDTSCAIEIGVPTAHPVLACLGSQYACWRLQAETFVPWRSRPGPVLARYV